MGNDRSKALDVLKNINEENAKYAVIHYSCESFYDIKDGRTPRITSIAIRDFGTEQTESFSIHKIAEIKKISVLDISSKYDELEKEMLDEFFQYIKHKSDKTFLHWNMRDINYGFQAIAHRYRVLGGQLENLTVDGIKKIDVARLLVNMYGHAYIGHPRLEKLIKKNIITDIDFLSGKEEAEAFENKEYVKLHMSTLRKADSIDNIVRRACKGTLKTDAKFLDIYGFTPKGIFEYAKENWKGAIILFIVATIINIVVPKLF